MTVTITKAEGTTVEEIPLIGSPSVNQTSDIGKLESVPLTLIQASDYNPRSLFEQSSIEELAQSIQEVGLIQPITLRHTGHNYEIIAGERRYRAYKHLWDTVENVYKGKYADIPAIIVNLNDEQASMTALIENLHRVELNPIERAKGYQRLAGTFGMTQQQIAEKVGINQATVSGALGLLKLPGTVIERLASGQLSASHGAALLQLDDADEQVTIADKAVSENWTVRHIRDEVNEILAQRKPKAPEAPPAVATLTEAAKWIEQHDIERSEQPRERFHPESAPSSATKEPVAAAKPVATEPMVAKETPVASSSTPTAAASTRITSGVDEVQPQAAPAEIVKPVEPIVGGITCVITGENADWLWEHVIDTPDAAINKLKELMASPAARAIAAFEATVVKYPNDQALTETERNIATREKLNTLTPIGFMSALMFTRAEKLGVTIDAEGNGE